MLKHSRSFSNEINDDKTQRKKLLLFHINRSLLHISCQFLLEFLWVLFRRHLKFFYLFFSTNSTLLMNSPNAFMFVFFGLSHCFYAVFALLSSGFNNNKKLSSFAKNIFSLICTSVITLTLRSRASVTGKIRLTSIYQTHHQKVDSLTMTMPFFWLGEFVLVFLKFLLLFAFVFLFLTSQLSFWNKNVKLFFSLPNNLRRNCLLL